MCIVMRFPFSNISRRIEKEHYKCIGCGKEFLAQRSAKRRFCSQSCSSTWNNIHNLTGWNVNKEKHLIEIKTRGSPHAVFIRKYGENEGEKRWLEFKEKSKKNAHKDSNAKWRFIAKYGEIDGELQYSKYLKNCKKWNVIQKTTTLDERLGKERADKARVKWSEGAKKNVGEHNGSFGIPRYPILTFYPEIGHKVRSSWELEVSKFLQSNNIKYQYEGQRYKIHMNDSIKSYTPDFVISPNLVIEVKGMMFKENYVKFVGFLDQYKEINMILICNKLQKEYVENLKKYKNLHMLNFYVFSKDLQHVIEECKQCQL